MHVDKIERIFDASGAEALFITDPHNMRYISGFRGEAGMLYISRKTKVLITDGRFLEAAKRESGFTVIEEKHSHKRKKILRECLTADKASIVGYEDKYMRCNEFSKLQNSLPEVSQWLPLDDQIDEIRKVKTEYELELLEKAAAIDDKAFEEFLGEVRAGMTELEACAFLEYRLKMNGAEALAFDTIVSSGKNTSMPNARPTSKKIEEGDFLMVDFGCVYQGYRSDMCRTIVIGKASEEQKKIYRIVREAQQNVFDNLRAGMTGRDGDELARSVIRAEGYDRYCSHATGHGVGLYIHEEPMLSPVDATVLEVNTVETVEPGIYIPDFGGARIEDMIVVTSDGIRLLTHAARELIEL